MKQKIRVFLFLILFILPGISFIPEKTQDDPVKPGAQLEKLSDGFLFTEGPSSDAKGNVYFTDQPNNRIMIWTTEGKLLTFMQPCGRSNGLSFDNKGYLWACADEKNEIWRISPDKKVEIITGKYNGAVYNGPNDLWVSPRGGIYFTDPFYKRDWWDHNTMPQESQSVYFLSPDHKTVVQVTKDLVKPNGIVGTKDGKSLFIADIGAKKTWSYSINPDGSLSNKKLVCEMGSDGMTIDEKGNLYLTGNGVTIFDKSGNKLRVIEVPESWTANVCFGDEDRKSLFITASKGLYRMKMNVKGAD
jgi:gluconolactonase